jgi:hypothetical protein
MMNQNEKILNWLQKETEKDELELKISKENFLKGIKKIKKEDIFEETKKEKLSLWKRLKKVLMGT